MFLCTFDLRQSRHSFTNLQQSFLMVGQTYFSVSYDALTMFSGLMNRQEISQQPSFMLILIIQYLTSRN